MAVGQLDWKIRLTYEVCEVFGFQSIANKNVYHSNRLEGPGGKVAWR
jgi:hypothetical protein